MPGYLVLRFANSFVIALRNHVPRALRDNVPGTGERCLGRVIFIPLIQNPIIIAISTRPYGNGIVRVASLRPISHQPHVERQEEPDNADQKTCHDD
jgi:hypothetical protein